MSVPHQDTGIEFKFIGTIVRLLSRLMSVVYCLRRVPKNVVRLDKCTQTKVK